MEAILMSIRPQWVAKILNGEKNIEIRKKFPKDYVGWVYIYCCAEDKNGYLIRNRSTKKMEYTYNGFVASVCWLANRKVVARFWCDKVEKMVNPYFPKNTFATKTMLYETLLKQSCLTEKELDKYIGKGNRGYAIHITKLEIFDEPKDISEFKTINPLRYPANLYRAPQSWCYIEGE